MPVPTPITNVPTIFLTTNSENIVITTASHLPSAGCTTRLGMTSLPIRRCSDNITNLQEEKKYTH